MSEEIDAHVERRYEVVQKLGKGAYGVVWKAKDRKTGHIVALKKIFDAFTNTTDAQRTYREVMFLQRVRHENIIRLLNVLPAENKIDLYLVFELMETDLYAVIRANLLEDVHKQYLAYQLLRCMKYLHDVDIIHRDIKPANMLLNSDCHMKLADFGLARSLHTLKAAQANRPVLTDYIATRWYRAPEILLGSTNYTKAVDVWAVGCIIGEMMTGKPLFPGTSTMDQLMKIVAGVGKPTKEDLDGIDSEHMDTMMENLPPLTAPSLRQIMAPYPREALQIMQKMLAFNPKHRISVADAMHHPFISPFLCPEDEEEANEPKEPVSIPISDDVKLSVDAYRDAIASDISKRRRDVKEKRRKSKVEVGGRGGGSGYLPDV